MRRGVLGLLTALILACSAQAQTTPSRLMIKLRSGAQALGQARALAPRALASSDRLSDNQTVPLAAALSSAGVRFLRALKPDADGRLLAGGIERIFILELDPGTDVSAAVRSLASRPDVEYVEPDGVAHITGAPAALIPNDSLFHLQWSLQNTGQSVNTVVGRTGADINATAAWNITTGNSNLTMAILDTGIASNASEFAGRIVSGWNFVNNTADAADDQGHGTAVASIAAATGGNGRLMAGIDWKCRIMPVKVIDSQGNAQYSAIASGIRFAADNGAKIMNLSEAGTTSSQALQDAVTYAAAKGAIVVASAGNDNSEALYYPAALNGVIAVGATNSRDGRALPFSCGQKGSNYGSYLAFSAPGDYLLALGYPDVNQALLYCGTSVASPVVSGTISLLLSVNPSLSFDQIYSILRESARDQVGGDEDLQGWDKYMGWGRIDAYRSLLAAQGVNLFSQFAIGSGYTTVFTFLNTGKTAVDARISLSDGATGNPVVASFTSPSISTSASSLPFTVPPGGTYYLTATGPDLKTGWARVETQPSTGGLLGGVATFQLLNSTHSLDTVAGVLSSSVVQYATIPVDNDLNQQRFTGYAVANPGTSDINMKILAIDQDGNVVGNPIRPKGLNPLGPGKQLARFLDEDAASLKTFRGSMVLVPDELGATFSVVALVQAKSTTSVLFTAIPVIPSKAPNIK